MTDYTQTIQFWLTAYATKTIAAIVIFLVGRKLAYWITDLTVKLLERNKVEATLVNFLKHIIFYALIITVIIAALNQLGINTTSFLTVIGAAGLAIGLALKDSLSNFSAGTMLVFFRPFKIGDLVTAAGVTGVVKEISIFNTELASVDNQKIIVPNSSIMNGVIINADANPIRRVDLTIGIGYADDLARAKQILTDIVAAEDRVLSDPEPVVAVAELAESSVNLVCRPWVKKGDYWPVRFAITEQIKQAFDAAGISMPVPQRDVHLFVEKGGAGLRLQGMAADLPPAQ